MTDVHPVERIYNGFIPENLHASLDEYYRARMLVLVCIVSASVLLPFLVVRLWIQGLHIYPVTLFILSTLLMLTPLVLRRTASIPTAGLFLVFSATTCILIMCFIDGGILSPTIFALLLSPLFAIFFGNRRRGAITIVVVSLSIILLTWATLRQRVLPPLFTDTQYIIAMGASAFSLMIVLVSIAYMFMNWQRNVQDGLMVANQAKDDFLSGMSHELRTPLNSMLGFTDVLLHGYAGPINQQQRENLEMVMKSGEHLTELVEDLVNLTNIDAGKIELATAPINLVLLVSESADSFRISAEEKHITIEVTTGDVPDSITGDDTRIRQVLTNLVSNAIKFSPENGRIVIHVERNGPIVEISVSDQGPGIAVQNRERIFEKFYQVKGSLSGKTVGSGLGLYIARRLAELHGGKLNLARSDQGATFILALPISGPVK